MNVPMIVTVAAGSLVFLGGCASHTHQMSLQNDVESVIGSFTHEGNTPTSMIINIEGRSYEARGFPIRRWENLSELRQKYGFSSKHYQRITAGLDTDHRYYSTDPTLLSLDGSSMKCSLAWQSGISPIGTCVAPNGETLSLRTALRN